MDRAAIGVFDDKRLVLRHQALEERRSLRRERIVGREGAGCDFDVALLRTALRQRQMDARVRAGMKVCVRNAQCAANADAVGEMTLAAERSDGIVEQRVAFECLTGALGEVGMNLEQRAQEAAQIALFAADIEGIDGAVELERVELGFRKVRDLCAEHVQRFGAGIWILLRQQFGDAALDAQSVAEQFRQVLGEQRVDQGDFALKIARPLALKHVFGKIKDQRFQVEHDDSPL